MVFLWYQFWNLHLVPKSLHTNDFTLDMVSFVKMDLGYSIVILFKKFSKFKVLPVVPCGIPHGIWVINFSNLL